MRAETRVLTQDGNRDVSGNGDQSRSRDGNGNANENENGIGDGKGSENGEIRGEEESSGIRHTRKKHSRRLGTGIPHAASSM